MKPTLISILALLAGLVAGFLTRGFLQNDKEKQGQEDTIEVIVAKDDFNQWTPILDAAKMFEARRIPQKELPKNAVRSMEELEKKVLLARVKKGQVITTNLLLDKGKFGLDASIPVGRRAFLINASADMCVDGFIIPGSSVDVIHISKKDGKEPVARYILQNVLLRAVNYESKLPDGKAATDSSYSIILDLDQRQVLILAEALEHGKIRLSLRSFGDDKTIEDENSDKAIPPPPPPPTKGPPPASTDKNEEAKTVRVLVAKEDFKQWKPIDEPEKMFVLKKIPSTHVPRYAVSRFEDVKDRILLLRTRKGEIVCEDCLLSKEKSGVSLGEHNGNRAVRLQVTAKMTEGFVMPGCRVDVVYFRKKGDKLERKTVLNNNLVRAVSFRMDCKPRKRIPDEWIENITLELAPQETLSLFKAKNKKLRAIFRSFDDEEQQNEPVPPPK